MCEYCLKMRCPRLCPAYEGRRRWRGDEMRIEEDKSFVKRKDFGLLRGSEGENHEQEEND